MGKFLAVYVVCAVEPLSAVSQLFIGGAGEVVWFPQFLLFGAFFHLFREFGVCDGACVAVGYVCFAGLVVGV